MKKEIDYSPAAIAMRLERLSQLRDLCVSLSKSKRTTPRDREHESRRTTPETKTT
jgi:hypothetical protein